jgi:hypothetical protein
LDSKRRLNLGEIISTGILSLKGKRIERRFQVSRSPFKMANGKWQMKNLLIFHFSFAIFHCSNADPEIVARPYFSQIAGSSSPQEAFIIFTLGALRQAIAGA